MNITVTGATGFIGQPLVDRLLADGHQLTVLGRRPASGGGIRFVEWNSGKGEPEPDAISQADAVIHLAGEPVAQRWTPEIKERIRTSRVDGTRHLVRALSKQEHGPAVLICGSATGYYGNRGDEVLTEQSRPGSGFLEDVCVDWEKEADAAEALGIRVVKLRTGIVLGHGGGALGKMLAPFRMGVGGPLGSGKQWMPWIHLNDLLGLLLLALNDSKVHGALNGTAPNPVTNEEFTRHLGRVVHRPAFMPVPKFALHALFGEMADVMLASLRVLPKAGLDAGYSFQYPELAPALESVVAG